MLMNKRKVALLGFSEVKSTVRGQLAVHLW